MPKRDASDADDRTNDSTPLSRRAFLRLNAALIAVAGASSCSWRGQRVDTRDALQLLRAEDLLSLRVEFSNLSITHRYLKPARLIRERAGEPARITFVLPGQHIAEQSFADAGSPVTLPVRSFMARPTRLSFEWPADLQRIDLTTENLLDWQLWRFLPAQSDIAIPAGIELTPDSPHRWAHARRPVTYRGRSELWHTRLLSDEPMLPDTRVLISLPQSSRCPTSDAASATWFELAPNAAQRCAVDGKAASLRTLMLSPMGGWLDLYGAWDSGDVRRWEHRAAAGQDQRVVVEGGDGFLYPFGHRASVITVTERELAPASSAADAPRRAALLRKRSFVVLKEAAREYEPGQTAYKHLTVHQKVTPPLSGIEDTDLAGEPFWIETGGQPFQFHLDAEDWAGRKGEFSAAAVFVLNNPQQIAQAKVRYDEADVTRRQSDLDGQPAVVAPYRSTKRLDAKRSEGDTLLHLLQLEHGASLTPDAPRPFAWRTAGMQARIPALINNLSSDVNVGWFDYLDPEPDEGRNVGEVFAVARAADGLIPMRFSERADRSGGVAAPSINVEGISRIHGPVSSVAEVRDTGAFSPVTYFSGDAEMLGGFSLRDIGGEKSSLIPQFFFNIKRDEIRKNWHEETEADRQAPKRFRTTVESGLQWEFPLPKLDLDMGIISLKSQLDKDKASLSKLRIRTSLSKTFESAADDRQSPPGGPVAGRPSDVDTPQDIAAQAADGDANSGAGGGVPTKAQTPPVDWSATGTLTRFDLVLGAEALGTLTLGFESLSATLGSPKPNSADDRKQPAEDTATDAGNEANTGTGKTAKTDKPALSKQIECKLNDVSGTGALIMVGPLLALAKKLSESIETDISYAYSSPPAPYPASVPSVKDADASFSIGPIAMNDIRIGTFSITDVSVALGIGFYFFPRLSGAEMKVPGHRMTAGIGSPDKPLTVLQAPWGGIAHMALSVDLGRGLSGFQFGMGIACGTLFDFKLGKALCLGSLSVIYTYVNTDDREPDNSVTLMLRIDGKAHIAGWIDVTLRISASGTVGTAGWVFQMTIMLQVKIAFFTVGVSLELTHVIANEGPKTAGLDCFNVGSDADAWLQYQAAFAGAATA